MTVKKYDESEILTIKKRYVYRKYKDEGLIVDREQQKNENDKQFTSFHLNETGCIIIEQIKEKKSIKQIIKKISLVYDISLAKAEKDTLDFIEDLKKVDILD